MTIIENKYKSSIRLLNRLKFRRHKRIRSNIRAGQRRTDLFSGIGRDRLKRQYYLKKERLQASYEAKQIKNTEFSIKKKKYKIGSYLFGVICKFPRKYIYHSLGKDIMRKWYTMPFRLSMARFVGNRFLKTYYGKGLSRTALANLVLATNKKRPNVREYKNEKSKNFLISLEQRLDNTLLRLLHFKPVRTLKRTFFNNHKKGSSKYPRCKIKLPLLNYSSAYIKQQINHKHVTVANKATKKSAKLQIENKIKLKGFLTHKNYTQNLKYTTLLRTKSIKENNLKETLDFVQNLRLKRFTEIFYMTYRNLHFIEKTYNNQSVEKHIQPIFSVIGFNQSLFVGWPLISLLWISPFTTKVQANIMRTATKSTEIEKKHLQRLLRWKRVLKEPIKTENGEEENRKWTATSIPDAARRAQSKFPLSKCYASMIYGTRTCKWIKLQQGSDKNAFYNQIYKKTNFFELELEFFQLVYHRYI